MKVLRLLAMVLVVTLVAAACSGDSVEEASADEALSETTAGDDTGDGDNGGGGNDGGSTDTAATIPDSLPDIPGLSGECEALAEVFLGVTQVITGDPSAADSLFDAAQSDLPDALADDVALIAEVASEYAGVLEGLGIDLTDPTAFASLSPEQIEAFSQASDAFSRPEVEQAFDNIEAYGTTECENFGG